MSREHERVVAALRAPSGRQIEPGAGRAAATEALEGLDKTPAHSAQVPQRMRQEVAQQSGSERRMQAREPVEIQGRVPVGALQSQFKFRARGAPDVIVEL